MYKVTLINDKIETMIHHPSFGGIKVIQGEIKKGINQAEGFSFTILPNNPGYRRIRPFKTLVKVYNMQTNQLEFEGRIFIPIEEMDESGVTTLTCKCESELGFLNDSIQRYGEYHNMTIREFLHVMIQHHNRDVAGDAIDKIFSVGQVTVTNSTNNVYRYLGYDNTLDSVFDKLVDRLGGELRVRKENGIRYLDYLTQIGEVKQTEIRLAKNLKSIQKEVDPSNIITRLVPLGQTLESDDENATNVSQDRLTIKSVNGGRDYIEDAKAKALCGVVTKSHVWDDISRANNLLSAGRTFLQENNRVKVQYVITALDLSLIHLDIDGFEVGHFYPVINPVMGIQETLRVVGKTVNIIHPNENSLSFGDVFQTASQYQYEATKAQKNVVQLQSTVSRQNTQIGTLATNMSAAKQELQQLQTAIDEADLQQISQSVSDLHRQLQEIEGQIQGLPSTETIVGMQRDIESHTQSITAIQMKIESMEQTIETNSDNLEIVQTNVQSLEKRVEKLEEGGTRRG
ncbi:lysin [Bacillus thuringiensis]|uniref:Lysin n=1 Tax=Bacillus thuringiensis TaxID=1428 RepID=A0A9X7BWR3_BACTU|nr:phage tail spike protein [Bacillus thuringiensis]PGH81045.1 lysin [Bacillus thuringiensis]